MGNRHRRLRGPVAGRHHRRRSRRCPSVGNLRARGRSTGVAAGHGSPHASGFEAGTVVRARTAGGREIAAVLARRACSSSSRRSRCWRWSSGRSAGYGCRARCGARPHGVSDSHARARCVHCAAATSDRAALLAARARAVVRRGCAHRDRASGRRSSGRRRGRARRRARRRARAPALSWTDPLLGPGYQVATDSNLDWGQSYPALQKWSEGRRPWVAFFGSAELGCRHVAGSSRPRRAHRRSLTGWVAVSASNLTAYQRDELSWLRAYCPVDVLDTSILVYHFTTPPDRNLHGPGRPAGRCDGTTSVAARSATGRSPDP